jgi:hypothetical protein
LVPKGGVRQAGVGGGTLAHTHFLLVLFFVAWTKKRTRAGCFPLFLRFFSDRVKLSSFFCHSLQKKEEKKKAVPPIPRHVSRD